MPHSNRGPNAGRTPVWVDAEEKTAMRAALRGKPTPASRRYREFVETKQGQQRLPLDEAAPEGRKPHDHH